MWLDDIISRTNLDSYHEAVKQTAEDRHLWMSCIRAACLPFHSDVKQGQNLETEARATRPRPISGGRGQGRGQK